MRAPWRPETLRDLESLWSRRPLDRARSERGRAGEEQLQRGHLLRDVGDVMRGQILVNRQLEDVAAQESRVRRHLAAVADRIVPELDHVDATRAERVRGRWFVIDEYRKEQRARASRQR